MDGLAVLDSSRFRHLRGERVLLDREAAAHHGVSLKTLRAKVQRNRDRFPDGSLVRLTRAEARSLGCAARSRPLAFTELGVVALAFVLNSPEAVGASINIIRTLSQHGGLPELARLFDVA